MTISSVASNFVNARRDGPLNCEALVQRGTAGDYAELAQLDWVSRGARIQIMNLHQLAAPIQEQILELLAKSAAPETTSERALRRLTRASLLHRVTKYPEQMELRKHLQPSESLNCGS